MLHQFILKGSGIRLGQATQNPAWVGTAGHDGSLKTIGPNFGLGHGRTHLYHYLFVFLNCMHIIWAKILYVSCLATGRYIHILYCIGRKLQHHHPKSFFLTIILAICFVPSLEKLLSFARLLRLYSSLSLSLSLSILFGKEETLNFWRIGQFYFVLLSKITKLYTARLQL